MKKVRENSEISLSLSTPSLQPHAAITTDLPRTTIPHPPPRRASHGTGWG